MHGRTQCLPPNPSFQQGIPRPSSVPRAGLRRLGMTARANHVWAKLRRSMKKLLVALSALFAGACCTSLPRLPAKERSFPSLAADYEQAAESREVWSDERRNREVPVTIYKAD